MKFEKQVVSGVKKKSITTAVHDLLFPYMPFLSHLQLAGLWEQQTTLSSVCIVPGQWVQSVSDSWQGAGELGKKIQQKPHPNSCSAVPWHGVQKLSGSKRCKNHFYMQVDLLSCKTCCRGKFWRGKYKWVQNESRKLKWIHRHLLDCCSGCGFGLGNPLSAWCLEGVVLLAPGGWDAQERGYRANWVYGVIRYDWGCFGFC